MTLDQATNGQILRVMRIHSLPQSIDLIQQLEDIGFIPGEQVSVLRRNILGGDPMMIRVGTSTFALRKNEAAFVEVEPL
ncbi:FeoA family protein [Polynucleobacter kasalickyi]|uniref:Ferrous iron transport protein A n=1 Tax=Polynucleobacter kasalickyi TaxID=1938817 RepID=A0A1W1YKF3_9BURK|nr:FeoA family protein [Polynucleobacter kasalickyi]SMC36603.1 ferrous iron transport protein A [Polynucleobacter kasalickyi]